MPSIESSDDEVEEREKPSSPRFCDEKRIKRKEERESRRLKKLVLREMNGKLDEEGKGTQSATPAVAATPPNKIVDKPDVETPTLVGDDSKAAVGNRSSLFDEFRAEIISKFHQAENLKEMRKEYRDRC